MRPGALLAVVAAAWLGASGTAGAASDVLVMGREGTVHRERDRYLPAGAEPATDGPRRATRRPAARAAAAGTRSALRGLLDAGEVDRAAYDRAKAAYDGALHALGRLRGTRRAQLHAVVADLDTMAARGRLEAARLPALVETLERNVAWWTRGPLLGAGARVRFAGSRLVWQHYAGQGLQIQWLATFGKANGLFQAGGHDPELRALVDEALALAGRRAGGVAFEYLFPFDGGAPPWVSGLAQGTALSALSRAAVRLGEPSYFEAARSALGIFGVPPPEGVAGPEPAGTHFLQYSFAPRLHVLNGFVQALNGLHDFAALANDDAGRALFAAGEAELRAELPSFDTGGWSRYSQYRDSDLAYHRLLRDFLRGLCERMADAGEDGTPYCDAAARFTADLHTPPRLTVLPPPQLPRRGHVARLELTVDKPVRLTVVIAGRRFALRRALHAGSGLHAVAWRPSRAGAYRVRIGAVDLAGNGASIGGTAHVRP